jgi:hypothetical protein
MDPDPDENKINKHDKRTLANVGDVLSAIRLRCVIQIHNGYNWFILGSRYRFLFYIGFIFYIIFFIKRLC